MSTINSVSPEQASTLKQSGATFIDVREPAEFDNRHIINAKLHPLGSISANSLKQYNAETIVVYCQKGMRSEKACSKVLQDEPAANIVNLSGGIEAWEREGLGTEAGDKKGISLDRQVQIFVGGAALGFSLLAALAHPNFLWGAAAIGLSLLVVGFSGFARIIALAPWNR